MQTGKPRRDFHSAVIFTFIRRMKIIFWLPAAQPER
jgi:hypothetical protein